jgi:D-galactarolactone cycloisomerase
VLRTLWGEPRPDSDGSVAIPDAPGIGIDVTPEHLAPHLTEHWSLKE